MKYLLTAALIVGLTSPVIAQEFEHCSITPVDQVGFIDTFTKPGECVAACKETDGCDSWTFIPHSFDASMPGQCKLIKGIFAQEESTRMFCGKV